MEFDILVRPLVEQNLTLMLSAAYIDAVWGDFPNATCYAGQSVAQGCVNVQQDLSGNTPQNPSQCIPYDAQRVMGVSLNVSL